MPLDVDYPRDRLAWQMEDCAAALVLTDGVQRERLPIPRGVMAVDVTLLELDAGLMPRSRYLSMRATCLRDLHVRFHWAAQGRGGQSRPLAMHCQRSARCMR